MQKRTNGSKKRSEKRWANANRNLSRECVDIIRGLTASITDDAGSAIGDSGERFALEYLHSEYLSKYNDSNPGSANLRKYNAVKKWLKQEEINRETNKRLRGMSRLYNILPRISFYSFLRVAQNIVEDVLGPLVKSELVLLGTFSGGASTSRTRKDAHPASKFVGKAHSTMEAWPNLGYLFHEAPLLREFKTFADLEFVEGAELFTVPKNADIDRCACKEPDVNMFLQKGVGRHIRKRLRKFNINLNDQSTNRSLARLGSLNGDLATLDLSAASDSVTTACVEALLPRDWFLYLDEIRSQRVIVGHSVGKTEMFSSMGNGFTFELESLLFYALARTVSYFTGTRGIISVYGDDIIVPSSMYDDLSWVLGVFGFQVNPKKSFHTGPFRESCGGHYFNGRDVTPFYLRREPARLTDLIRVANQLRKWLIADDRQYSAMGSIVVKRWQELKRHVPAGFWGGSDLDVDTQLVSSDVPRFALKRVSTEKTIPDDGAYLYWHCSNWNRDQTPEETGFGAIETTTMCRSRRASGRLETFDPLYIELNQEAVGMEKLSLAVDQNNRRFAPYGSDLDNYDADQIFDLMGLDICDWWKFIRDHEIEIPIP